MRKGSPTHLKVGANNEEQSSTNEPEPMTSNAESKDWDDQTEHKDNDEGDDESGEEREGYKEDPWYYQDDTTLTLRDGNEADSKPEQAIAERKELNRELRYQIQNEALERLFRQRPGFNTFTKEDKEEQESSSVAQPPPMVTIPEWGQTRQKTLQEHNEEWKVWNETNIDETTPAYRHDRCQSCSKPVTMAILTQARVIL